MGWWVGFSVLVLCDGTNFNAHLGAYINNSSSASFHTGVFLEPGSDKPLIFVYICVFNIKIHYITHTVLSVHVQQYVKTDKFVCAKFSCIQLLICSILVFLS